MTTPERLRIVELPGGRRDEKRIVLSAAIASGTDYFRRGIRWKRRVQKAIDLQPDVILVDVSMPHLNGFETAKCIHDKVPQAEILIVTEQDSKALAHFPSQPGVRGYVRKSFLDRDLLPAVEAASKHRPLSASAVAR